MSWTWNSLNDSEQINTEPYRSLRRRLAAGTFFHAYIISGAGEEERLNIAHWLSSACVCLDAGAAPCGHCTACRKAAEKIHPDIITVDGEPGKGITVAQAREARADAFILPNEARRKIYLFPHGELMSQAVQNVLLKLLEEGPGYAVFLLLTDQKERLLPTVRSRCESLLLSGEEKQSALPEQVEAASVFADKLLRGDLISRMEAAIPLEKLDRDEFDAFLCSVIDALFSRMEEDPARIVALIEKLRKIRSAIGYNVGTGHLTGWLFAKE